MRKSISLLVMLFMFSIVIAPCCNQSYYNKKAIDFFNRMNYEKEYNNFIKHLGYKESHNNWKAINSINCIGEYQFTYGTLKRLGYHYVTPVQFKTNPDIFPQDEQRSALNKLISLNMAYLNDYSGFINKSINGITITKAGMIAGSHLGGPINVKLFLITNGKIDKADLNGTKISDYIREFSIYNL